MNDRTESMLMGVALALAAVLFYFCLVQAVPVLADGPAPGPARTGAAE